MGFDKFLINGFYFSCALVDARDENALLHAFLWLLMIGYVRVFPDWGSRCRRFKSCRPDQLNRGFAEQAKPLFDKSFDKQLKRPAK